MVSMSPRAGRRLAIRAMLGFTLVAVPSCASDASVAPAFRIHAAPRPAAVTSHVVVISIDGLRPDAITSTGAPTLWTLAHHGSFTFSARTILPSKTLPSHTSMLTGVPPTVHGVTWNSDETAARGVVRVPTVFAIAHAAGRSTAAFFSKTKFHHLEVPGSLDHDESPPAGGANRPARETIGRVERFLQAGRPSLLFIHIGEPDYAGHKSGWMSGSYRRAVAVADSGVARVVAALDAAFGAGAYTLIITADHGGHGTSHGSADPRDTMIPWIASGAGVARGRALTTLVRTMDTAATALWLLGVDVPGTWAGAPVDEAFGG
jgi:predicted AlkP superfamily pyrophosphatase or phosphodiesterase